MAVEAHHCDFVLLADFDIHHGAQLTYQFPQPLGLDEGLLETLMLPDGAEKHSEDWTIFFLNQTPLTTIAPVLALDPPSTPRPEGSGGGEVLYVLNLVRTKRDTSVNRGAVTRAMAICTRHPFIQIFKPVLLMALDDYYADPSQECLERLFDAINSMDISGAPVLTHYEKLVMRAAERKDIFAEKFHQTSPAEHENTATKRASQYTNGSSILNNKSRPRADSSASTHSTSDTSITLGGSAVWVSNGSTSDHSTAVASQTPRPRRSTDASATSGSTDSTYGKREDSASSSDQHLRLFLKDTHYYHTSITYNGYNLPIKMPLFTFPEEVGEYSLIQLIQTFATATVQGPMHPHLHTNGSMTHPIMVLLNALLTGKRIIFLGHTKPAGLVSNYVLAACALGSGSGCVFRGFISRAFPYAALTNRDEWESIPGYIVGTKNPLFEQTATWDLLLDITTGRMVVGKDIHSAYPGSIPPAGARLVRGESFSGPIDEGSSQMPRDGMPAGSKSEFSAKADNPDNVFIEDVIAAISYHYGESLVRSRFVQYVVRFARLASRYEELTTGTTRIGFPSSPFVEGPGDFVRLGSGMMFTDDTSGSKELTSNASRIEAWRRTTMYEHYAMDFRVACATDPIQGFDVVHQLLRLRHAKQLRDREVDLIFRTLVERVQTHDQIVQLLSYLPPHLGGLQQLSFGLFHSHPTVRELAFELLNNFRAFPVGIQFLQGLNHFHRFAFIRQAASYDESRHLREQNASQHCPPVPMGQWTLPNHSEPSLNMM